MNVRRSVAILSVAFVAACAAPDAQDAVVPGWRWTEAELFTALNAVRAGRSLQPESWPNGARVAVLLSFDVDNETIPLRYGEPTIGGLSQGEYGARVALPRVVNLLDRHDIPASFFIPAMSLRFNPGMADVIKAAGHHEFAIHGWIHELNSSLEEAEERELLERAVRELQAATGYTPVGYRAPSWNFSPNTLKILRDMGFTYESSMMADDRPYELMEHGQPTGIVELPVEWILDDAPLLNPLGDRYSSPRDVLQVYIDEFDKAYEEGTMFLLTMHPHYIGHRSRIVILEGLIAHILENPGVWFATHRQAAEYVRAEFGMEE
jgi:peptidoglycan-N-acetylglucosamine deacetylase